MEYIECLLEHKKDIKSNRKEKQNTCSDPENVIKYIQS